MQGRYDAVIIGGGLIGAAMAVALARHGLHIALADRQAPSTMVDPAFDGRAYAVSQGSANLLAALGLWQAIEPQAQSIRQITVSDGLAPVSGAPLHFDPTEVGRDRLGWIVEDRVLRSALLEAVATDEAIASHAPAQIDVVNRDQNATRARINGADIHAPLMIACDGRRSPIARAAGIRYLAWPYRQMGLVTAIEHTEPHGGLAHQSFLDRGPFAVLPLQGNRSSLVWSEAEERARRLHAADDATLCAEISARIGGRLGTVRLTGRRWLHPLGLALASAFVGDRLALVGDAAHGVHPIAGQGMNMGLRDVAALTEVVVAARQRGDDIGSAATLESYQRWRRFDATTMSLGMDAINRTFSTAPEPVRALGRLALGVAGRSAAIRHRLMAEAAGEAGTVPRLLAGASL